MKKKGFSSAPVMGLHGGNPKKHTVCYAVAHSAISSSKLAFEVL